MHTRYVTPCRNSCPAKIDVPGYIRAIQKGDFTKALAIIKEKTPFPATLGRVCFHPCENACRLGDVNKPVSICSLKRFAASAGDYSPLPRKDTGKKVAIIGAGPAGLTAAYFLRLLGHSVIVYESLEEPGGMLRVGITAFRLPREVLNEEIRQIENLGIKIVTNRTIENPEQLLRNGQDAVFIATGAHQSIPLGIPGENSPGVIQGINYLREVNFNRAMPLGDKVAVIGGSNVAVNVARTAIRLGTKSVTVVFCRSINELPAFREEVKQAEQEGVVFEYLLSPKKIIPKTLLEVCFARMEPGEPDSNGQTIPVEIKGIEISKSFNSVIVAVGQRPSMPAGIKKFYVNEESTTNIPGIFAGGDVVTGPSSVVEAVAVGRRAADAISRYLGDIGLDQFFAPGEKPASRAEKTEKINNFANLPRVDNEINEWHKVSDGCLPDLFKYNFKEINLGIIDGEKARLEASRCLQCDLRLNIRSPALPHCSDEAENLFEKGE